MGTATYNRINQYIEDAIAAERNFEDALASFGKAGVQQPVQDLLSVFSLKAKTQHERLTALLESRGGSPSGAKTALAEMLAFSPLSAQIGQGAAEKNTQHLVITFAAAAAEMAMYESLAAAAREAGEQDVLALATTLQSEEQEDYKQVWNLLHASAASAFEYEISKGKTPEKLIATYIEDAIAVEKSFETQLLAFSKEGNEPVVQNLFAQHAEETKLQYERLTTRLHTLGGSPSMLKSLMAHIFNMAPKAAQLGHDETERVTQNLMMAYAVENAEIAMYEALADVSRLALDSLTEQLALTIQKEEQETANKIWAQVAPAARQAITVLSLAKAS